MKPLPIASDINLQIEAIKKGSVEIIEEPELIEKIKESIRTGVPLNVKAGFDPTSADLHLGHTVLLHKLKTFQDLGHVVTFIIGDFTATIGDPSGRNEMRKPITAEQIMENAKTYKEQALKILRLESTNLVYNSSWMDKLTSRDLIEIAAKHTVARMLERDDFSKRFAEQRPIGIHELMYPIIQGYDSVAIKSDVELGGTDQKFNLLVGRNLQRSYALRPQSIITMPILEGLDGVNKMSKSLGNYVGITESPKQMFGKIMSISDELMFRYYELLSDMSIKDIEKLKNSISSGNIHPMQAKQDISREIVKRFHGEDAATFAEREFITQFREKKTPEEVPRVIISSAGSEGIGVCKLLKELNAVSSTSEARRKIQEGAVRIGGEKIEDENLILPCKNEILIQVGKKRFYMAVFEG
ncbi:MAG: tyrosine--tRNA ligase [Candidatus Schekmanbacteria bacterium]|nr:tyrosine--tRNA ligase [Candidatus Schekmanbacteria bacterium]